MKLNIETIISIELKNDISIIVAFDAEKVIFLIEVIIWRDSIFSFLIYSILNKGCSITDDNAMLVSPWQYENVGDRIMMAIEGNHHL